jgi:hypothetical protein
MGILLSVLLCPPAPAQQKPKEMTFPSGRKVTIVAVEQIETKDAIGIVSALLLEYETRLKITDTAGLQKEVDEIWPWLKVDVQHRKLTEAIIQVLESPTRSPTQKVDPAQRGWVFAKDPDVAQRVWIFTKQSDGSWRSSVPTK